MKLVIAEKPSVAKSIANAIGAHKKTDAAFEGNGYIVSWCVGHLVCLAQPSAYSSQYDKWRIDDLPIAPEHYKYEVIKASKAQFNVLKVLLARSDIDSVINACDAGREGESIFRLVYMKAGCKKPMYRLWISSMEDSAIRNGFDNLVPGEKYDNLFAAACTRNIADWLVGMNLSRLYSCKFRQVFSVGRVQTPTLALIAARDKAIKTFQKEKYYTVCIKTDAFAVVSERINDKEKAERIAASIRAQKSCKLDSAARKEKITLPARLYDLTTLQREANKLYGFSAKKTLDALQALYEKKLTSYPRTDSRYLTNDMKDTVRTLLSALDPSFVPDEKNFSRMFDSSKVSDHYAVIPTLESASKDINTLDVSDIEKTIYALVRAKFLACASESLVEDITTLTLTFDGITFTQTAKQIRMAGWTKYAIKVKENKDTMLEGDVSCDTLYPIREVLIEDKYTKPPAAFNENTLLHAMEIAGTDVLDKSIEVERKGIGTPATRASIIENLISKGFVVREKKALHVTGKGIALLCAVDSEFTSARLTAQWETKLSEIARGTYSTEAFLEKLTQKICAVIQKERATT